MEKCKICGKDVGSIGRHVKIHNITSKKYYDKYLRKDNDGKCPICGKSTKFRSINVGYLIFCSPSCSMKSESTQKALNKTMQEKYGVDYAAQNKDIYNKVKKTTMEKYGVDNIFKQKEIRDLAIKNAHTEEANKKRTIARNKTIEEKYNGVETCQLPHVIEKAHSYEANIKRKNTIKRRTNEQNKLIIEKHRKTVLLNIEKFEREHNCTWKGRLIEKYGQGWLSIKNDLILLRDKSRLFIDNSCISKIEEYYNSDKTVFFSKGEKELVDFLYLNYNGSIIENTKEIIPPYELDIYLPELKLAIEYNGIYWHSINFGKNKDYHLLKTKLCAEKNIRLIHIFENEWSSNKSVCESIILSALNNTTKVYAKNCIVQEVSSEVANKFLDDNHLQGAINSSYRLGLFNNNELVQLICIGKSRFNDDYELLRMCSKVGIQVIGGFSKLMKYQPYNNLISYVDRSKFDGKSYLACGYTVESYTPPSYFYWRKDMGVISRYKAQKHKLKQLLGDNYDKLLSESENMISAGFYQLFNCGNIKMRYVR